jgi:pilus assembly protein Flp/PilA
MMTLSRIRSAVSRFARRLTMNDSGQGMTEYVLIVAFVAIGSIAVVSAFGRNVRALFQGATNSLAGQNNEAQTATDDSTISKTLKNFSDNQQGQ